MTSEMKAYLPWWHFMKSNLCTNSDASYTKGLVRQRKTWGGKRHKVWDRGIRRDKNPACKGDRGWSALLDIVYRQEMSLETWESHVRKDTSGDQTDGPAVNNTWLFLQRTWSWYPAPTQRLITVHGILLFLWWMMTVFHHEATVYNEE